MDAARDVKRSLPRLALRTSAVLIASLGYLSAQPESPIKYCEEIAWPMSVSPLPSRVKRGDCALCEQRNDLAGECFEVHGRINLFNGNPTFRMWIIGTNRLLGLVPDESPIVPLDLRKHLVFGNVVYGDFRVCPFTDERPGFMRYICVESVKNIVIEDYRNDEKKLRLFKGPWSISAETPNETSK